MAAPSLRRTILVVGLMAGLAACGQQTVPASTPVPQAPVVTAPPPPAVALPPVAEKPAPPPLPTLPPQTLEVPGKVKVALLVPLSGRTAVAGRALQDAAELAVFDFADDNFALLPFDTEAMGVRAAAETALASGAKLILGPLFGPQTREIADLLAQHDALALSFSNDVAAASPTTFIFGLGPSQSIERAVKAAREKGAERFAALLPADGLGQRIADTLRKIVPELGGTIARIEMYSPGSEDLTSAVKRVGDFDRRRVGGISADAAANRSADAARRASRLTTRGDVGYQALIMTEMGLRMRSLAPLLPYYDIDASDVRYIGPPQWDDVALTAEPAMVGAWFAAPDPTQRIEFEAKYRAAFGRAAPRIATLAYDAVALAATLAHQIPDQPFSREILLTPSGFAGVDGLFRLRPDGIVERGLSVLEIKRNAIEIAVPAPASFDPPATN